MMWRMAEGSEGELRACRGNGAENSSQSKVGGGCSWEREWGRAAAPILGRKGSSLPAPGEEGRTASRQRVLRGTFTPTAPSHFLSFSPLALAFLITKQ